MVGPCVPVCPHLTTPHHHFLVLEWQVNGKMPVGGHKYQNIILGLINTHNMITPTVSSLNNKKKRLLTSLFYTFYRDMTTLKGSFNELIILLIMRVLCEQLWPSSVIIISAANCSVSLSHCLTVSLSHCALSVLLWRKEAQSGAGYGADSHNRLHVKKNTESLAVGRTVVVLIMINVGNNHLWNKSQLELNNAWGISFIEKQSDKSARHSSPRSQPVGELPRQELCMKMK